MFIKKNCVLIADRCLRRKAEISWTYLKLRKFQQGKSEIITLLIGLGTDGRQYSSSVTHRLDKRSHKKLDYGNEEMEKPERWL